MAAANRGRWFPPFLSASLPPPPPLLLSCATLRDIFATPQRGNITNISVAPARGNDLSINRIPVRLCVKSNFRLAARRAIRRVRNSTTIRNEGARVYMYVHTRGNERRLGSASVPDQDQVETNRSGVSGVRYESRGRRRSFEQTTSNRRNSILSAAWRARARIFQIVAVAIIRANKNARPCNLLAPNKMHFLSAELKIFANSRPHPEDEYNCSFRALFLFSSK